MREKKDATLVKEAFAKIPYSLNNVQLFHTDRGKEFDNQTIDEILWAFNITRSLSKKAAPMITPLQNPPINLSK